MNPEQLFAAGYAACFHSALMFHAGKRDVEVEGSSVSATVGVGLVERGGMGLEVALTVLLPGVDKDVADELADLAHAGCPYSRAIGGNVDVTIAVAV